jgi:hypothetical protein
VNSVEGRGFNRGWQLHRMIQYQDCPLGVQEVSFLQSSSMMVINVFILNESRGKLEVTENKEHKPRDFRLGRSASEDHIRQL